MLFSVLVQGLQRSPWLQHLELLFPHLLSSWCLQGCFFHLFSLTTHCHYSLPVHHFALSRTSFPQWSTALAAGLSQTVQWVPWRSLELAASSKEAEVRPSFSSQKSPLQPCPACTSAQTQAANRRKGFSLSKLHQMCTTDTAYTHTHAHTQSSPTKEDKVIALVHYQDPTTSTHYLALLGPHSLSEWHFAWTHVKSYIQPLSNTLTP